MTEEKHFFEEEVFSKPDYEFSFEPDEKLILDILKYKKSGKVFEFGCGEGGTSIELAKRGFEVTCIDISKSAIDAINKEAKSKGIKINAVCADLENYDIKENYDIFRGNGFFHFLKEKITLRLIKNCQKHTNKEGINIFDVLLEGDPSQDEDSEGYYFPKNKLKYLYVDWKIEEYKEHENYDEKEEWNNKLARIIAIKC